MKIQTPHTSRRSGISLVLVLFAIVTLSFLIVLYFSLASNDRSSTTAYTSAIKADELGASGLELVIEELRKEISDPAHSTADESPNGPTIYTPISRDYMVPEAIVSDPWGNLVKMSKRNTPSYTGGQSLASEASTVTPSRNGRFITAERWARPLLAQPASLTPDWVYIGRQGPVVNPALADAAAPSSPSFVLGRFAFTVYDIGGLVDANVAGYPLPPEMPAVEAARKGNPALVKLQTLGLTNAQVEDIIAFRNPSSRADYVKYLEEGKHKGFTRTLSGDNRFLSRQELIRFARRGGFEDHLRYLTVFSREKNAPSYIPASPTVTNPSFLAIRHADTGRLVFERRFPLSRLQLFQDPATNASDIQKYFGLTYNADTRSFTYGDNAIKTPAQVAQETSWREPNFFEVLKAGILAGSIGQTAGVTAMVADDADKDTHIMQIGANIIDQYDLDPDRDSAGKPIPIPTTILFAGKTLYGVEDLPYVNKISFLGENPKDASVNESFGNVVVGYENNTKNLDTYNFLVAAELWNPNFQSLPNALLDYNPQIRVSMEGDVATTLYASTDAIPPLTPGVGENTPPHVGAPKSLSSTRTISPDQIISGWIRYMHFSEPYTVRMARAMDPLNYDKREQQTGGNTSYRNFSFNSATFAINSPITVELAVLDANGIARPYYRTLPTAATGVKLSGTSGANTASARLSGSTSIGHSDPRTNRLGYYELNFRPSHTTPQAPVEGDPGYNYRGSLPQFYATTFAPNPTVPYSLRPRFDKFGLAGDAQGYGVAATDGLPSVNFTYPAAAFFPGLLWENTLAQTRFRDPDGQFRQSDGGFAPSNSVPNPYEPIRTYYNTPTGWPTDNSRPAGTNASRPTQLDRPFRSVADLGYVFRDIPWRSLNFSSSDSGDAALLDAFSIEDNDTIAGRINFNSAKPLILQSLLEGSLKEENKPASTLQPAEAQAAAEALFDFIDAQGPLSNISEIVTAFSTPQNLTSTTLGTGTGGEPSFAVKTQREGLIRALAGTTQTRTWNFLIDLVAQSGRVPPNAATLSDFVVEGEKRYWLHVAIDRYTGEVVSELLETVTE